MTTGRSRVRGQLQALLDALRSYSAFCMTVLEFTKVAGELPLTELVQELTQQVRTSANGDSARAEAMLIAQAHTLDAIFNELARRAQRTEYLSQFEAYLRLGLKAQGQCRATLETLGAIKNPAPVAFVRQANIAHGPQQVNNAPGAATNGSRARETESQQNKLLEKQHGERLEFGAAQEPVGTHPTMATVGKVHGPTDLRG
jgi:hypothetical protein